MSRDHVEIQGRSIGPKHPPYVVAELSGNHNGELQRALDLIEAAKDAGADAVKLQTYTADTLTLDHDGPEFTIASGPWAGRTLYDLYDEAHTPWEWHQALFDKGRELGITVFSSPFDPTAVDFLEGLGNPAFKIASFEAIDLPLIGRAAKTGKPVVISTGIANADEIADAVNTARENGDGGLILLHCTSAYPAPAQDANLRTIPDLAQQYGVVAGLSDHTIGTAVSIAAIALGACFIEKHFTLRRDDGGPDAAFSLEPEELKQLVTGCRDAWDALGTANYDRKPSEAGNVDFRRSLYAVADIAKGDTLTNDTVRSIRPGHGLPPKALPDVIGGMATRHIARGTALEWDMIDPANGEKK